MRFALTNLRYKIAELYRPANPSPEAEERCHRAGLDDRAPVQKRFTCSYPQRSDTTALSVLLQCTACNTPFVACQVDQNLMLTRRPKLPLCLSGWRGVYVT